MKLHNLPVDSPTSDAARTPHMHIYEPGCNLVAALAGRTRAQSCQPCQVRLMKDLVSDLVIDDLDSDD